MRVVPTPAAAFGDVAFTPVGRLVRALIVFRPGAGTERYEPPLPSGASTGVVAMKIYSERLFLKYLFSNHGLCFGVDMKQASYLFLVSRRGVILKRRPVGDKVVENLDYEIPQIVDALEAEERRPLPRAAG